MNHLRELGFLQNRYYVMRHGTSVANNEEIIVSHPDDGIPRYGLADEGRQQVASAVEEAKVLHGLDDSTLVVASDFARTRETAEIARDILHAEMIVSPKLRERFFGTWDKQHHRHYQNVWDDDVVDPDHKNNFVESTSEVLSRLTSLIRDLEASYSGRTILLVSHGDALQILQTAFERVPSSRHRLLSHLQTGEIRKLDLKSIVKTLLEEKQMEKQVTGETVSEQFTQRMGRRPTLVARGPGRVNLIGEHTDYNDGFVLPVAIDRAAFVAAAPRDDRVLRVWANHYEAGVTLDLDNARPGVASDWAVYVLGMAAMIERDGYRLQGADLLIDGDVPGGAGLSSSAALENAVGAALAGLGGLEISPLRLAQLGQRTEHEFAGVKTGIMDQMIYALGQANHALLIDCRSYEFRPIPMPSDVRIVVCDSKVSRELAASAYNERRAQCEEAVARLQTALPDIKALRDVTPEQLEQHQDLLSSLVLQRARHIVTENARTLEAADRLAAGDLVRFGVLMNDSHRSLRDDYAVSSPQLDVLVASAQAVPGVYGARLTGAGFGGCTVSLTTPEAVEPLIVAVTEAYQQAFNRTPDVYVCTATDGARVTMVE